jgi:hypothetical protein
MKWVEDKSEETGKQINNKMQSRKCVVVVDNGLQ